MTFRKFKALEISRVVEFKDPDTGLLYTAKNLSALYGKIVSYRVQNQLEMIDHLAEVVANYLCGLPENCNKCEPLKMHRSWYTTVQGGMLLLKNMWFKKQCSQKTAEARAAQCVTCKFNVFPDKGPWMAFADNIAIGQVGDKHVSVEKETGSCSVCTCVIRSKVFWGDTLPAFPDDQVSKFREVSCWQLKLSGQDAK